MPTPDKMTDRRPTTRSVVVPALAKPARDEWQRLATLSDPIARFQPDMLPGQPAAVQQWLARALSPGTPLGGAVQLQMTGEIRLSGSWRPFVAEQISAPTGYIWAARTSLKGMRVTGFDRYSDGVGVLRWKLMGLVPVVSATGSDVAISAAGRLAAEIAITPTAFVRARWEATADPGVVSGSFSYPHGMEKVDLKVAGDGGVVSASMLRWGNPDGGKFHRTLFGADLSEPGTFNGVTIPTRLQVGWGWGTDDWNAGEFFRAKITNLSLLP